VADPRETSSPRRPEIKSLRSDEFDSSIFDKVAGAGDQERPDADTDDDLEVEGPPPRREGLPPGFRMRHDSHYVEELMSRNQAGRVHLIATGEIENPRPPRGDDLEPLVTSISDFGVLQPLLVRRLEGGRCELIAGSKRLAAAIAAGLDKVPCLMHVVDDERAEALAAAENLERRPNGRGVREREAAATRPAPAARADAEIGESLDAIAACLHLFRDKVRPAAEQVALELIEAEVFRATCLVQALAVLAEEPPVANRPVDLLAVVKQMARALAPGRSLAGAAVEIAAGLSDVRAQGDGPLLTVAVAGMVMALQAATERAGTAAVRIRVLDDAGGRVRVEATQDAVRMPASWRARFLDPEWTDRPGGRRMAVALAAAQRIAELHRGTLTLGGAEHGGCRLVLTLPRG
jgi:ParB/RepB/Spo0J family partition protein